MMSSLVPGAIFYSPGFNRKSTPTPPNISPAELDRRYAREECDGKERPYDSPVSRTYDVQNTSTKLIILNNKYGKNSTRLRGYYSGPQRSERTIDPCRHRAKSPRNPEYHQMCLDSTTPRFEPDPRTQLDWETGSYNRPQDMLAKSSVNPRRHASCQISSRSSPVPLTDRPRSVRSAIPPARYFTEFSDMSVGEKLYMWSIEKIYNVKNLKQLKQEQYRTLLKQEVKKGYYRPSDYDKYLRYINSASSRRYGTESDSMGTSRARSAYSNRSGRTSSTKLDTRYENDKEREKENERPKTAAARTGGSSDTKDDKENETDDTKAPPSPKPKSPSPSRKSSASARSQSAKSLRSKSSSRASSAKSVKSVKSSGTPVSKEEESSETVQHKEGRDRPKSRLGHKTPEDRDTGPIASSQVSVKSDRQTDTDARNPGPKGSTTTARKSTSSTSINSNGSRQNPSMGSRNSVRSKDSADKNVDKKANKPDDADKKDAKSDSDESTTKSNTSIHRVPSAGYDKRESETKPVEKADDKPVELTDDKKAEDKEVVQAVTAQKETESKTTEDVQGKVVTFSDKEKTQSDIGESSVEKSDTSKPETGGKDIKTEGPADEKEADKDKPTLENAQTKESETKSTRRDSLEESDDDVGGRRSRDPDKIQY